MNKKLILVAAPPACGKTYVSELISKEIGHIVYLDKDNLSDLLRVSFTASGRELDMDGKFYFEKLRPAEYSTIFKIAFSALRFEEYVLINAPFIKETHNLDYMKNLKSKVNANGAKLILIWIKTPKDVCYKRMKKRNSDRDVLKLQNWDEYVKDINFEPPLELETQKAVDKLIVFDAKDDESVNLSLKNTIKIILDNNDNL